MTNILNDNISSDENYIGRLDIQLLRSFLAIARAPTLSSAAKQMNIPQPTMSLQMKRLEERAGKMLFEPGRRGKPLRLSIHGEGLVHHAERIIDAYEDAVVFLRSPSLKGTLRLGLPNITSEADVINLLSRFKHIHEDVNLTIVPGNADKLRDLMADGQIDASICVDEDPATKVRDLWSESYHWICSTDKAILHQDPMPVALMPDGAPFRNYISGLLDSKRYKWVEAYTSESMTKLYASSVAGLTVAAVPTNFIKGDVAIVDGENDLAELMPATFSTYQSPAASTEAEKITHAVSDFIFTKMHKLNDIAMLMLP